MAEHPEQPLTARPSFPQPPVHEVPMHKVPDVAATGAKFVVLHEGLGVWRSGDVVATSQLDEFAQGGTGGARWSQERLRENLERLLSLKAIRPADHTESLQTSVKVIKEGEKNLSYESMVVDRDKEVDRLKMQNATLREQVDTVKRGGHMAPADTAAKDREIEDLKRQLDEAKSRHPKR